MKVVGVKILKARLSEYLRLVKAGEVVLVADRDDVIAELRPAHRQKIIPASLDAELEVLAERGEATLRTESIGTWPGTRAKAKLKGISAQEILDSLRDESR